MPVPMAVVAACAVALFVGGAAASSTSNHVVFTDPAGDNQSTSSTAYASDIRQIDVTSQDDGTVKFAVTLADGPAKLVDGDELDVLIDYDRNSNTGSSGFDIDLVAKGHTSSTTTFQLCRYESSQYSCEVPNFEWAHDTKTATGFHVVDFEVSSGVPAFDFGVLESWTPSGGTALTDIAPNSGLFTFETKADPDNDGKFGTADSCPTVRAVGKYDTNNNGCPGPFKFIGTKEAHFSAVVFPAFMRLNQVRVTGAPPGSRVVFSSPKGGDSATANRSGVAKSRRVKGDFRYGSVITIRITRPQFVGVFLKEKIARNGLRVLQRRCIPATGGSPVKCSGKLKAS
jgi:hypothetical protein